MRTLFSRRRWIHYVVGRQSARRQNSKQRAIVAMKSQSEMSFDPTASPPPAIHHVYPRVPWMRRFDWLSRAKDHPCMRTEHQNSRLAATRESPVTGHLILTNKTVQENTDKQTQYKSEKVNNLKYSKTKLHWFSCLLQHSARKRDGLILQRSRAHTGRYSLGLSK